MKDTWSEEKISKNVDLSLFGVIVQPSKHTFEIGIFFSRFNSLCIVPGKAL